MANLNNKNLKLAVQKSGRLTEETLEFLRRSGLEFTSYKQKLFSNCRNFPLEILYVRDDDIPNYVATGTVDLGIVGQNILNEERPDVSKIYNLNFGYCSLYVAVPKDSKYKNVMDLDKRRVATSYPVSAKSFFRKNKIEVEIVTISGSLEITPALGIADAIVDLVSTGSTLALNDLRILDKVYDSEAVLIANKDSFVNGRKKILDKLLMRFNAVLSARDYKYIMMNVPKNAIGKIKKVVPGLRSPTISALADQEWVSMQTVVKEEFFWDTIEKLKKCGATGIIVLPIEKMIL